MPLKTYIPTPSLKCVLATFHSIAFYQVRTRSCTVALPSLNPSFRLLCSQRQVDGDHQNGRRERDFQNRRSLKVDSFSVCRVKLQIG